MRQAFWWILCLIGCVQSGAAGDAMDMSKLQGRWVLESINGQRISPGAEVYFEIDGTTITGFDGCNKFGGSLDAPDQMRMTQRGCVSDSPGLPLELSDPRSQLDAAKLTGEKLTLPLPGGTGEAGFSRQKP
jgi:heat shock protein HslJ